MAPSGLLRACELLEPQYLVNMLKAVKHLSMNATLLEVLQNANSLEILIRLLDEQSSGSHNAVNNPPEPASITTYSVGRRSLITYSKRVITSAA